MRDSFFSVVVVEALSKSDHKDFPSKNEFIYHFYLHCLCCVARTLLLWLNWRRNTQCGLLIARKRWPSSEPTWLPFDVNTKRPSPPFNETNHLFDFVFQQSYLSTATAPLDIAVFGEYALYGAEMPNRTFTEPYAYDLPVTQSHICACTDATWRARGRPCSRT
jgi:hypothetical protein